MFSIYLNAPDIFNLNKYFIFILVTGIAHFKHMTTSCYGMPIKTLKQAIVMLSLCGFIAFIASEDI